MAAPRWIGKLWRSVVNRLPERMRNASLGNPLLAGVMLLMLFVALVLLLTPSLPTARVRMEPGQIAPRDYRATHTFTYEAPDPNADSRARAAEAKVPRIYRYDPRPRERLFKTVLPEIFDTMRGLNDARKAVREELQRRHEGEWAALGPATEGSTLFGLPEETAARRHKELRRRQAREMDDALREYDDALALARAKAIHQLGPDVPAEVLDVFLGIGFPDDLRQMATSLLGEILEELIVEQRAELVSEMDRGIDVVLPQEDAPLHIVDINEILTRSAARRRAAMWANRLFAEHRHPDYFNDDTVRGAFVGLVTGLIVPTAYYDPTATRAARQKARDVVFGQKHTFVVQADQIIVLKGQVITAAHIDMLEAMQGWEVEVDRFRTSAGAGMAVLLLLGLSYFFGLRHLRSRARKGRDLVFVCVVLLVHAGLIRLSMAVTGAVTAVWGGLPVSALFLRSISPRAFTVLSG